MRVRWTALRDRISTWACWLVQGANRFLLGYVREDAEGKWIARVRADFPQPDMATFDRREDAARWFLEHLGLARKAA